jgi:hypothetical protein
MIQLLLPWSPALGRHAADATAAAVQNDQPWLQPRLMELATPPGPETALAALDTAGEAPVLVWTGATALDPAALDPAALASLPAAVPLEMAFDVAWDACEGQLHLPVTAHPETFAADLIWAPDAAALAVIWRDSEVELADALPPRLWPHQRLLLALPLSMRRLAPGRALLPSQRLPPCWRRRQPVPWARPDDPTTNPDGGLHDHIWSSDDPCAALTDLARRGLRGQPMTTGLPPYGPIKAAARLREPTLVALAWEQLQLAPPDPQHWGLALDLWLAAGRSWPWTLPKATLKELPEQHQPLLLQCIQAGWLPAGGLEQPHQTVDAMLDALPDLAPGNRELLQQAYRAAPASLRFPAFGWSNPEAADPRQLHRLTQRITTCLSRGKAFSLVRLGDGEGLFLAGQRPCLGGATLNGEPTDPRIDDEGRMPPDRLQALIRQCLQAIQSATVVGVPDLSQCLQGPKDYPLVLATLWRALPPPRRQALAPRLLPGGCHLHLYWLASGAYERPPFTDVHGVIAPQLPPSLVGRCLWQPIPGEKGHHPGSAGPAHYPVVFENTLDWIQREAGPGRLFLVGAGILGKIYCDAIRQQGGVAIDVGSVMDLCCGLTTSRGEFRLNPFLVPLAARAFPQAEAP